MLCGYCNKPSSRLCARCKCVAYCSKECQSRHWKLHKLACGVKTTSSVVDIEDLAVERYCQKLRENATECHCSRCCKLCQGIPGAYDPVHVLELAAKDPAFYSNCVEDFHDSPEGHTFYLRPRLVLEKGGERVNFFARRGECSFLGPTGCSLKRENMPLGCVTALGCMPDSPEADKNQAPQIWGTENGKKAIRDFEAWNRSRGLSVGVDEVFLKEKYNIQEAAKAMAKKPNQVDPDFMLRMLQFLRAAKSEIAQPK